MILYDMASVQNVGFTFKIWEIVKMRFESTDELVFSYTHKIHLTGMTEADTWISKSKWTTKNGYPPGIISFPPF